MQKSIKKILSFVMIFTIIITTLSVVAFAADITPSDGPRTLTLNSSYNKDAVVKVTGGLQVPSHATDGLRVYANVHRTGTTAYEYDSYLVYTLDVNVDKRVETSSIANGVYGRIYFDTTYAVNLPLEAIGTTGDSYKVTVIVTPDKEIYTYCNNKLYGASNSSLPASFKDIRYYEKPAANSTENNLITFTYPTVTHYPTTCELSDILYAHAGTTNDTINWTAYRGTSQGNNAYKNYTNGAMMIDNDFGRTLKVGQDSFVCESSISVNERNETFWRNENLGMGVTMIVKGKKPDGSDYTGYFGIVIEILQENKEYPLTMILDKNKNLYIALGDSYVECDISEADTITGVRYCEGNAVDTSSPSELVFEPAQYTFLANSESIDDISSLATVVSTSQPMYVGYELADGEFDLTNIKDKNDEQNNLTEGTAYALMAARFGTLLSTGANNVEYGMLISEEIEGNELTVANSFKAEGVRNANGCYGILLYGNRLVPGNTIYARPYLKYLNKYYYGEGQSIVIPQASQAE